MEKRLTTFDNKDLEKVIEDKSMKDDSLSDYKQSIEKPIAMIPIREEILS